VGILRATCSLQRGLGDLHAAESDCREALALALEVRGPQHHDTVDVRRELAALLVDSGRLGEAEVILRATQGWLVSRLGVRHGDVARNENSMAMVARERGDLVAANASLEHANATWRQ